MFAAIADISANADYQLTAGLAAGANPHGDADLFAGALDPGLGGSYAALEGANTASVFSFLAGMTALEFASSNIVDLLPTTLDETQTQHDLIITNGDGNAVGNGSALELFLSGTVNIAGIGDRDYYGIRNNADVGLTPVYIPEPGMLALLGVGMVGVGVARRKRA